MTDESTRERERAEQERLHDIGAGRAVAFHVESEAMARRILDLEVENAVLRGSQPSLMGPRYREELERFGVRFVDDDEVIGVYWLPAPKGQPVAGSLREALEARAAELRTEGAAAMRVDLLVVDAGKLDLRCENDRLSGLDGAVAALGTSEAGIDIDNAYGWGGVISVGGKSIDTEAETLRTLLIAMAAKLPGASQ